MKRLALVVVVLGLACGKPAGTDGSPSVPMAAAATPSAAPDTAASATNATSAPTGTTASTATSAPSASATPSASCMPLAWDSDALNAHASSFTGTIRKGEGTNGTGATERFQTLALDEPVCGPDKAPVAELQLYTNDASIGLAKMVGKKVTLEGEPFAAHTAHHHRPIVVEVKKLTAN